MRKYLQNLVTSENRDQRDNRNLMVLRYYGLTVFFLFSFFLFPASAQQLINNKGNRNQSYPVITETNPNIVSLINQVSKDSIESHIRYMQQFKRGAKTPEALIVQNWLIERFESYGYPSKDIYVHSFSIGSQQLKAGNVVVFKEGTEFPNEYIMITSHYDHSSFDFLCGPGANDNASGTSGVLECARLLKDFPTKRSIMFVPFSGEEYWMMGSMPFAQKCASENLNIIAHFNMDMIGYFPAGNPNTIMASGYSYISKALFEYYQQTANTYIPHIPTIRLTAEDTYGGDNMPFNVYEYPSLYIGDIENKYPPYHEEGDTIGPNGLNRLDLARNFVQAVLSATTELANGWLPPQNLSACSGTDKITVSWDGDKESSSYKIYKNNGFLKETTDTFYDDYDVEIGSKYEYYVIAVNNNTGKETAPSNKDEVMFVKPLQLPYSNNFNIDKFGFEQSNWVIKNLAGKGTLCNTSGSGSFTDNYLSFAESDWFSIPYDTKNISIHFKWRGQIDGIWFSQSGWLYNNAGLYFEVTNDRKTWHKLAHLSGSYSTWQECSFSLNEYINSVFFQVRFRMESSGAQYIYTKIGYITDFEILLDADTTGIKETIPYISSFHFSPNPANQFINITTNQQKPYHIAIYDMTGKLVFEQDNFQDGQLSVAHLKAGNYLIVASTKQHRVAKKLVVR